MRVTVQEMPDIFEGSANGYEVVKVAEPLQEFLRHHLVALIGELYAHGKEIKDATHLSHLIESMEKRDYSNLASLSRERRTISKQVIMANESDLKEWVGVSTKRPDILVNSDIYYRIIDAQLGATISRVHRDVYFHNILDEWKAYSDVATIKMWVPLYLESTAVLGVVPGSHLDIAHDDCSYTYDDGKRSEFSCSVAPNELTPIPVRIGEALLFPSSLLHGSLDKETVGSRRISAEITLGYQKTED